MDTATRRAGGTLIGLSGLAALVLGLTDGRALTTLVAGVVVGSLAGGGLCVLAQSNEMNHYKKDRNELTLRGRIISVLGSVVLILLSFFFQYIGLLLDFMVFVASVISACLCIFFLWFAWLFQPSDGGISDRGFTQGYRKSEEEEWKASLQRRKHESEEWRKKRKS